jgi:hypothetical protein
MDPTPCEVRAMERVKALVSELWELRPLTAWKDLPAHNSSISEARFRGNVQIRTLARIVDAFGFDLVINVRERP